MLNRVIKQQLREVGILGEESKNEVKAVKELYDALSKIKEPIGEQAYYSAIDLFNAVSKYQDVTTGKNPFPKRFAQQYATLQEHVKNAGRDEFGINRTSKGKIVGIDNTYWGNQFGLWTQTTREWLQANDKFTHADLKPQFKGITTKDFVARQIVAPFVKSHLEPMKNMTKDIINGINKNVNEYYEKQ